LSHPKQESPALGVFGFSCQFDAVYSVQPIASDPFLVQDYPECHLTYAPISRGPSLRSKLKEVPRALKQFAQRRLAKIGWNFCRAFAFGFQHGARGRQVVIFDCTFLVSDPITDPSWGGAVSA
jgi:hypothetical protein